MSTLDRAASVWRQVKRVVSVGAFAVGAYLLWTSYSANVQEPVTLFIGAVLTVIGVVGTVFPSKVRFLSGRGGVD